MVNVAFTILMHSRACRITMRAARLAPLAGLLSGLRRCALTGSPLPVQKIALSGPLDSSSLNKWPVNLCRVCE